MSCDGGTPYLNAHPMAAAWLSALTGSSLPQRQHLPPLKGLGDFPEAQGRGSKFCGFFSTNHLVQVILNPRPRLFLLLFLYGIWSVGWFPVIRLPSSLCSPTSLVPLFTLHISLFATLVTLQSTCSHLSSTSSQLFALVLVLVLGSLQSLSDRAATISSSWNWMGSRGIKSGQVELPRAPSPLLIPVSKFKALKQPREADPEPAARLGAGQGPAVGRSTRHCRRWQERPVAMVTVGQPRLPQPVRRRHEEGS